MELGEHSIRCVSKIDQGEGQLSPQSCRREEIENETTYSHSPSPPIHLRPPILLHPPIEHSLRSQLLLPLPNPAGPHVPDLQTPD